MNTPITPLTYPLPNAESPFQDLKAGHVGIRTTRIEALLQWYRENLNFRILRQWEVGTVKLAFMAPPNDDGFIIEVICYDENEGYTDGLKSGFNHLSFWVADLDTTLKALEQRGIPIQRSFAVPAIAMRVAFIDDTFGNSIEFCETMKP